MCVMRSCVYAYSITLSTQTKKKLINTGQKAGIWIERTQLATVYSDNKSDVEK